MTPERGRLQSLTAPPAGTDRDLLVQLVERFEHAAQTLADHEKRLRRIEGRIYLIAGALATGGSAAGSAVARVIIGH